MSIPCTRPHAEWFEAWLADPESVSKDTRFAIEACPSCKQERAMLDEIASGLDATAAVEQETLDEAARRASAADEALVRRVAPVGTGSPARFWPALVGLAAAALVVLGLRLWSSTGDEPGPGTRGETFLGAGQVEILEPVAASAFTGRIRWRSDDSEIVSYAVKIMDGSEGASVESLWSVTDLEALEVEVPPEEFEAWPKDLYILLQAHDASGRPIPNANADVRVGPGF